MTNINIKRNHNLGLENARIQVEKIAQSLKEELQIGYEWDGNRLLFERSGASGIIVVTAESINLDIKLGLALSLLAGPIEESINKRLDVALS